MNKLEKYFIENKYKAAAFCGVFAYILGAFHHETLSNLATLICMSLFLVETIQIRNTVSPRYARQYFIVFLILSIFFVEITLHSIVAGTSVNNEISIVASTVFPISSFLMFRASKFKIQTNVNKKASLILALICLLFVLLNLPDLNCWFKSDGYTYYSSLMNGLNSWNYELSDLSNLGIAGHLSQGYTLFLGIGAIFGGVVGVRIINMCIQCISICAMYFIEKKLLPKLNTYVLLIFILIYVVSPSVLGMSYELYSDYAVTNFFIWFVACDLYDFRILSIFTALCLCFSKEIAIVILFFYLLGKCIVALKNHKDKATIVLLVKRYWPYVMIALLFLFALMYGGMLWGQYAKDSIGSLWNGNSENCITVNFEYIVYKLKELYIFDFAWISSALILLGLVIAIIQKKLKLLFQSKYLPLALSYVGFLLYNFLYFTYAHYRYLQMNAFYLFGILVLILSCIEIQKCIVGMISAGLFTCNILQSYSCIDPISLSLFRTVDVGNGVVNSTKMYANYKGSLLTESSNPNVSTQVFYDSMLYNREQLHFEKIIESFFTQIGYDGTQTIIIAPIYHFNTSYTAHALFGRYDLDSFYWDETSHNVTDDKRDTKINIVDLKDYTWNKDDYTDVYYIKFPYSGDTNLTYYESDMDVDYSFTITSGKWKIEFERLSN